MDLRGSDALYGQFSAGAVKLLSGQRTESTSQQSEASESHTDNTHDEGDNDEGDDTAEGGEESSDESSDGEEDEGSDQSQRGEDGSGDTGSATSSTSSSSSSSGTKRSTKKKELNLRGTAGLYQHMSQGALKSRAEANTAAPPQKQGAKEEEEEEGDESKALVAEWMAKEKNDKKEVTADESKEKEDEEGKGKEKEGGQVGETADVPNDAAATAAGGGDGGKSSTMSGGRRRRGKRTGGGRTKGNRRTTTTKRSKQNKKKMGEDVEVSDDDDEPLELRIFRQTPEWLELMREVMVELEPNIRFPMMSPYWLIEVEKQKLVSRRLITEAYRHQALMRERDNDRSLYTPPKNNPRIKPRNYITTVEWDTARHGLHIQVADNGKSVKKLQSHWYSVALAKDGYDSGRHYWAIKVGGDETYIGVATAQTSQMDNYLGVDTTSLAYNLYGNLAGSCATMAAQYLPPFKKGDVIGVLLDMDKKELSFYKNGASSGLAFSHLPALKWYPAVGWRAGHQTLVGDKSGPV